MAPFEYGCNSDFEAKQYVNESDLLMARDTKRLSTTSMPKIINRKISSFSEFLALIQTELNCGHWLYRGLSCSKYELIPGLARPHKGLGITNNDLYEYEMVMIRHTFAGTADQDTGRNSDINQLLLAQHHGAPTRLLDWTSSALVAAYFASEASQSGDSDQNFKIVAAHVCPQSVGSTHFSVYDLGDVDFYQGFVEDSAKLLTNKKRPLLKKELKKRGTIFVQGSDISPRVAAQQGYVSIQAQISTPIDQQQSENITCVVHVEVDAKARKEFQETLYQLGIRHRSIFPDVDALFESYENEKVIHDRLCEACNSESLE